MAAPEVSVLMAVRNGLPHVRQAVDSILGQTLRRLEFVIVDDGSSDDTYRWIERRARADPRIVLLRNDRAPGVADSANVGLARVQCDLVARMDADDISRADRLASQVSFMERHPGIAVCGTWVQTFGGSGGVRTWRYPTEDDAIRCTFLFECCIAQPSVMFRRSAAPSEVLRYDPSFVHAQDYDLWSRLAQHAQLANLPRVLLKYRCYGDKTGARDGPERRAAAGRVRERLLGELGVGPSAEERAVHDAVSVGPLRADRAFLEAVETWLLKLRAANQQGHYPEPAFSLVLAHRWLTACRYASGLGSWVVRRAVRSALLDGVSLPLRETAHLHAARLKRAVWAARSDSSTRW